MDALLGPDEIRLREDLRAWAQEEFSATAGSAGPGPGLPPDFVERFALRARGAGVFSPAADPRLPAFGPVLMLEGISSVSAEAGFRLAEHVGLCIPFLLSCGSPEQQERYLPALAAGRTAGRWLWVEAGAAESGPNGWLTTADSPFDRVESGPETIVLLSAFGDGGSERTVQAFIFDERDRRQAGGNEARFFLPGSCRMDVVSRGFPAARAAIRSSSSLLLGCFLGAAADLLESSCEAGRTRGAFETLILEARDIQVRLSEVRVGLETLRCLLYRALLRRTPGLSAEESDRLLAETLVFLAGVLDLAGRLEVPGWSRAPALGVRRARALVTSLGHILL